YQSVLDRLSLISITGRLRMTDDPGVVTGDEEALRLFGVSRQSEPRVRPVPEHGVHRREELAVVLRRPVGPPEIAASHVDADRLAPQPFRKRIDPDANRRQRRQRAEMQRVDPLKPPG